MTYEKAARKAQKLLNEGATRERTKAAVDEVVALAPENELWRGIQEALERGDEVRMKERRSA